MENERTPMQLKRELKARMKELKPLMHRGAAQEVASKLGLGDSTVYEVIAGRRWDLNVIEEIIAIGEKNLKRVLEAEKKLDKIKEKREAAK